MRDDDLFQRFKRTFTKVNERKLYQLYYKYVLEPSY